MIGNVIEDLLRIVGKAAEAVGITADENTTSEELKDTSQGLADVLRPDGGPDCTCHDNESS